MTDKEEFLNSEFYKKYKDTYYAENVLYFNFSSKPEFRDYNEAYNNACEILESFFKDYYNLFNINEEKAKEILQGVYNPKKRQREESIYLDPDEYSIRKVGEDIVCSGDALISLKRLLTHYGVNDIIVEKYKELRKYVIFNFPREKHGINQSRGIDKKFNDRIDWTLYDIKNHCSDRMQGKLINAYMLPNTKKWFEYFNYDFEKIIDWFGVRGIFTNEKCEVYDLEDNSILNGFENKTGGEWSESYLKNLIAKIKQYNQCKEN